MEKAKTRKIKKWDEVHGEHEVEVSDNTGGCEPEEVAGAALPSAEIRGGASRIWWSRTTTALMV